MRPNRLTALVGLTAAIHWPAPVLAQASGGLQGTVRSEHSGEPISGAQIFVMSRDRLVHTDEGGTYLLKGLAPGPVILRITHPDFITMTERVFVDSTVKRGVDFAIPSAQYVLDEVRAIVRKPDENAAVIDEDELGNPASGGSLSEVLDRVSGVQLVRTGGEIGKGYFIRIRGAKSFSFHRPPVIYLDGIRVNPMGVDGGSGILELIDEETVGRVEVLRGAAATVKYGPDAADGVILISTKRGG